MIQWLLDGSALLVGGALLNPTTGAWTPLPLTPESRVAVGTAGRVATLDLLDGDVPHVRILSGAEGAPSVRLPEDSPTGGAWVHELVGDEVYVHNTSLDTGEARCWRVDSAGVTALDTCLEGGFAQMDRILPAGAAGVVIESHGEGHPGVDLIRWDGAALAPVPLPWEDLYPFGPLELLPRVDGSFDILTRCALGPPRPCLREDGLGSEDQPARWYRWSPGQAPVERAVGQGAEVVPDPASDRVATVRGKKVCVGEPGEKGTCWRMPRDVAARMRP